MHDHNSRVERSAERARDDDERREEERFDERGYDDVSHLFVAAREAMDGIAAEAQYRRRASKLAGASWEIIARDANTLFDNIKTLLSEWRDTENTEAGK